jgi:hypothetical protein
MFSPFVFTGLSFILLLRISYNRFYLLVEALPNNGDGSGGGGKSKMGGGGKSKMGGGGKSKKGGGGKSKKGGGGKGMSKIYGCGM